MHHTISPEISMTRIKENFLKRLLGQFLINDLFKLICSHKDTEMTWGIGQTIITFWEDVRIELYFLEHLADTSV